ncbi:Cupredoxin [Lipomyces tetrasporus]|uniref:Cupredoxin n=1 Tax=Lipomyces tetrasporus TaxID=54092 RepID=A0AAD7QMW8_9ASCO|nr:Cupredoxin [Lipomyces tetrasporus]KAJ8098292.1 Cupredoxin [Lipomyces tetrasporus]
MTAEKSQGQKNTPRRRVTWFLLGGGVLIIAAIASGLGIGLRHDQNSAASVSPSASPSSSPSSSSPSATSSATASASASATPSSSPRSGVNITSAFALPDWKLDTSSAYRISKSWNSSEPPTTREFNLTISEVVGWPDGYNRTLTVINGQFPGPLIEVNMGDRLIVNVQNNGANMTTIHFHGMYQNKTNFMDGTYMISQCGIPPGGSFTYNFTVPDQYGTYWYHSHYRTQYMDGVIGPFVIHSQEEDDLIGDMYDYDQVVLVSDWYHGIAVGYMSEYLAPNNENAEPVPDNGLINGAAYFDCSLTPDDTCYQQDANRTVFAFERDKTYRLRVINTGAFAEINFSVDEHPLTLVEGDGTLIQPTTLHKLKVAVAQRYSVLVTANVTTTDTFWVRAELDEYCFAAENPILTDYSINGVLVYTNDTDVAAYSNNMSAETQSWGDVAANVQCLDLNNTSIEPMIVTPAAEATVFYRIDSSFQIWDYAIDLAYMNGTTWSPASSSILYQAYNMLAPSLSSTVEDNNSTQLLNTTGPLALGVFGGNQDQYIVNVPDYEVVDILINNLDDGAHPFHLHGYKFWVIGSGYGTFPYNDYGKFNTTNPMRRDTVTVVAYGWVLIRFVADNAGVWPLHCHITWHLEAGLLMQFQVQPKKIAAFEPPAAWAQLCEA